MIVKNDRRSKFSNLSNWKEEALKNQGFQLLKLENLLRRSFFTIIYILVGESEDFENTAYNNNTSVGLQYHRQDTSS